MAAKVAKRDSEILPEEFSPVPELSEHLGADDIATAGLVASEARKSNETADVQSISLSIPMREMPDDHYRSRYINIPGLTADQANAAKALFEGLHFQQARLSSGRYVKNVPDAIRYLLERMSDGLLQQLQK